MRAEQPGARRAQRDARPRRPAAARPRAGRHLAPARAGRHPPPARVPAPPRRAVAARDRTAAVGAALRGRRAPARRRLRSCWWRRAPRRTPSTGCCARRSRGWRTSRCACSPPPTGARHGRPIAVPRNARLVDWVSYARTMPQCAAVVCHAGHGTVVRALASGVPVVACPYAGDMAENAARAALGGPRRLAAAALPDGARRAARPAPAAGRSGLRRARRARARLVRRPRRGRGRRGRGRGLRRRAAARYAPVTWARLASPGVTRPPSLWIDRDATRDPDAGPFSQARWRRQVHEADARRGTEEPPEAPEPPPGRPRGRVLVALALVAAVVALALSTVALLEGGDDQADLLPAAARRPARADAGRPRLPVGRAGRGLGAGRLGLRHRLRGALRRHDRDQRPRRGRGGDGAGALRRQRPPGAGGGARHRPLVRPRGPARRPRRQRRAAARCRWPTPTRSTSATASWRSVTRSASTARRRPGSCPGWGARSRRPTASRSTR